MIASTKRKINIALLLILPLFLLSRSTHRLQQDETSIQFKIDKREQDLVDREIQNYKSLIKMNLTEIELKLYFQEYPFKIVE